MQKCEYIKIVIIDGRKSNTLIDKFRADILEIKKVSKWWGTEIKGSNYLYKIKSSKEIFEYLKTNFIIDEYNDCIINGDLERGIEVIQNIIENAIKYVDGQKIEISFSEEDGCILVTIINNGCTLLDTDLTHMFESFWRGTNALNEKGSGLGLYICRELMNKMNGEIFANIKDGDMHVTVVFGKIQREYLLL